MFSSEGSNEMFKPVKIVSLLALVSLLAVMLVACGDPTATTAPAATTAAATTAAGATAAANSGSNSTFYVVSGASATNVPDALKTALSTYESQYTGAKAQAFKISESSAKVKDLLASAFTKEGWTNVTPNVPDAGGGFALGFTKSNKGAAVVAFPGAMAGLGATDLLYIVFVP
jgi:hypothetical protein